MRALLGALALLLVLPMGARGDGDWNDDDLPYTMATRLVSGDVLSDANLPLRLTDPTTGAGLFTTNTDPNAVGVDPLTGEDAPVGTDVGFGAALRRFVHTGVLNGDFALPPPDPSRPIDNTENPLPYWTWTPVDGTVELTSDTDSAYASGRTVTFRATGAAGASYLTQFVPVPLSRGQQYRALLSAFMTKTYLILGYTYYQNDATSAIGTEKQVIGTTDAEAQIDAGLVPTNAAYIRIRIQYLPDLADTSTIGEVRAAFLPAEATVGLSSRYTTTGAISTTETQVVGATIPANSLVAGSQYVLKAFGTLSVSGGVARTATFRLRVGPTTLTGATIESMNPTTTTTASGDGYMIEATLTIASTGATGDTYGTIEMNGGSQPFAVGSRVDVSSAAVTIDTTVANVIELTAETSNAAATTTFRQAYIQCVMAS